MTYSAGLNNAGKFVASGLIFIEAASRAFFAFCVT
jgi:hypothetical protein